MDSLVFGLAEHRDLFHSEVYFILSLLGAVLTLCISLALGQYDRVLFGESSVVMT